MKYFVFIVCLSLFNLNLLFSQSNVHIDDHKIIFNDEEFFPYGWYSPIMDTNNNNSFSSHIDVFDELNSYKLPNGKSVFNTILPNWGLDDLSSLDTYINHVTSSSDIKIIIDLFRTNVDADNHLAKKVRLDFPTNWIDGNTRTWINKPTSNFYNVWPKNLNSTSAHSNNEILVNEQFSYIISDPNDLFKSPVYAEYISFKFAEYQTSAGTGLEWFKVIIDNGNSRYEIIYWDEDSSLPTSTLTTKYIDLYHNIDTYPGQQDHKGNRVTWKNFNRNIIDDFDSLWPGETFGSVAGIEVSGIDYLLTSARLFDLGDFQTQNSALLNRKYNGITEYKNNPQLFAWYPMVEPDTQDDAYGLIWHINKYKLGSEMTNPGSFTYPTYIQEHILPNEYLWLKNTGGNHLVAFEIYGNQYKEYFKGYNSTDILMVDHFNVDKYLSPWPTDTAALLDIDKEKTNHFKSTLPSYAKHVKTIISELGLQNDKTVFALLPGHGLLNWEGQKAEGNPDGNYRKLSPFLAEYRYLVYSSIIQGARGIMFWTFHLTNEDILRRTVKVGEEFFKNDLDKVLLKGEDRTGWVNSNYDNVDKTPSSTWAGGNLYDLNYIMYEYPANSNVFYLFVSNDSDKLNDEIDVIFHFSSGLSDGKVETLVYNNTYEWNDEDESKYLEEPQVELESYEVKDTFKGFDVRVYKITANEEEGL